MPLRSRAVGGRVAALAVGTEPARPLGVFRAAVGAAALAKGVDLAIALQGRSLASGDLEVPAQLGPLVATTWLATATGLMLGLRPRACAVAIVALTAFLFAFADLYSNHGYLLATLALLLALTDCGAAFSLDARLGHTRERVASLGVTLIRVQISVIYAFSALAKVNQDFLPGNSLYYHARHAFAVPEAGMIGWAPLFAGMAVGAILLELFLAAGLWFARVRPAAFVIGLALHGGMVLILSQGIRGVTRLTIFAVLALSCCLLFLDVPPRGRTVVWDGSRPWCATWVRWVQRLDWLGALRFVPDEAGDYVHGGRPGIALVDLEEERHTGFEAVRRILEVLPVSFLWAPVLGLAPVRALGRRPVVGGP